MIDINELEKLGFNDKSVVYKYTKEIESETNRIEIAVYYYAEHIGVTVQENNDTERSYISLPYRATIENIKRLIHALSDGKENEDSTIKTATCMGQSGEWFGESWLYHLSELIPYIKDGNDETVHKTGFVVVSDNPFMGKVRGLHVFPSDRYGTMMSSRVIVTVLGSTNPEKALNAIGYTIKE
jgi:hypothetical protein